MMVWNSDDLLGSNGMGAVSLLAGDRDLFFPGNIRGNTGDRSMNLPLAEHGVLSHVSRS